MAFPAVKINSTVKVSYPRDMDQVVGVVQDTDIPLMSARETGINVGRISIFSMTAIYAKTKTMLKVEEQLLKRSPLDTHRFRSSWVASVGSPSDVDPISEARQEQYRQTGQKFRRSPQFQGKNVWFGRKRQQFYLTNNVPYASYLALGGSIQAPPGWISAAIRKGIKLASFDAIRQNSKRKQARRSS